MRYIPLVRSFGDGHKTCFDRVNWVSIRAIMSILARQGVDYCDGSEIYSHMRSNSFRNPFSYSMTEGHTLAEG